MIKTVHSLQIVGYSHEPGSHSKFLPFFIVVDSLSVLPKGEGGQMRLYGLLGGQVCIRVQSVRQTRGFWGHAPPGNLILDLFSLSWHMRACTSLYLTFTCCK